jgi:hypothetical protein
MKITAKCGMTIDLELTHQEFRVLKLNGLAPIDFQQRFGRIESTNHFLGRPGIVVLKLALIAGDTAETVVTVDAPA